LAHTVDDYNLLMAGNECMLAEHIELRYRTEDLESEQAKARAEAVENIEAHIVDVAADGGKQFWDFEKQLVKDLEMLQALYVCNVQSIGGLYSLMAESEPSAAVYLRWLSTELTGLPEMIAGVKENFISVAVEGTLVMVGSSVYLGALHTVAVDSRTNILPVEKDVRRAAHAISKKWWH
jgi:hypothetical protein